MIHLSKETEALAHRVAAVCGLPVEDAIKRAIEESMRAARPALMRPQLAKEELIRRMEEISARCAVRPLVDPRSPDELIGYYDYGLPR